MSTNSNYYLYSGSDGGLYPQMYRDENGKPVSKTPHSHPYSYDAYLLDGKFNNEVEKGYINGVVYDDRLLQADYKKYEALKEKYLSKGMNIKNVEKFLKVYYGNDKITMVNILKGCNVSNGYPYHVFQYHIED